MSDVKSSYSEKLANPQWQRKRLEIFERDNWTCQGCDSKTKQLEVHHTDYWDLKEPWEYDNDYLITACHDCHKEETARHKHEKYLLRAFKESGFMAVDILALSCILYTNRKFSDFIKNCVRRWAREGKF